MKKRIYIAILFLLGALTSGSAVYAAESCPKDSVVTRDENNNILSKNIYGYDSSQREIYKEIIEYSGEKVSYGIKTVSEYTNSGNLKYTESWQWNSNQSKWIGTEKTEYTYNQDGYILSQVKYNWGVNDWVESEKYIKEYDLNNQLTLYITYGFSNGDWVGKTKQEISRDINGNIILNRTWEGYDTSLGKWIGKSWNAWEYSSPYLKTQATLKESYSWKDGDWYGESKAEYGFNESGKQNLYIGYLWDVNSKAFVNNVKVITDFDKWNNVIYSERYFWDKSQWVGQIKERFEFIEGDITPIMTATFAWDVTNGVFIGVDSIRIAKDADGNQILDEQYKWSGNDWAGTKKEEYIYDANKLILSTITYAWDLANKTWNYGTKVLADYNANKMQILDERYQWSNENGGYWKGTQKDSTVYNAKNVETASFSFQWDDANRRWLGNTKYRKEFDAANNLILEEQYNWQMVDTMASGGFWKGIKKEEYAYNAAKQQTLAIIYAWSDAIEDWIGDTKKISNYDSNKNQILNEQYTWHRDDTMAEGGYWQGTEKATYTFNKNKQQTSSWVYAWNDADTAWVYDTRDTASYDAKKNQTLDERYTWDAENSKWVGDLKKEYGYNASNQQIMFAYYQWDNENNKWIGTQKEEDEQDAEGRTILKATYTWGTDTWVGKSKDTYTYFRNDTVYEHITYEWKTTTWVAKNSTIDSYSENGEHTSTATFKYDATKNIWVGQKLTAWAYTESGKIYIQEEYVWGTTDWVKSTRLVNTYTDEKITSYTTYKWENEDWVKVKHWEQVDANIDRTYEWLTDKWSITQENKKTYDDQNRLILEQKQNWQAGVQTAGEKTEYTYTGSNLTQKSNYTYDSGISDWVETDRLTNAYDGANRQTLTMTQTFSGGVQTKGDKTTNTYNADGKQTNTTTYTWVNNDWQNVSKTDNEYNGKTTITTNYTSPDGTTWQGVDKQEKEYGEGKDVTITQYEWSTLLTNWVGTSKTGYTYYASGKEKSVIDYRWTGSDWVADTQTEYEYSGTKNIVTATYSWETDKWVGQSKIGYFYDEGEDQTTATWDWKDGKWVGNTKMGETFDQFGNRTGQTTYTWNGTDFVYKQKTEIEYGISSKDKTTATYNWNGTAWVGQSKSGVTYNGAKIASETSYTWISGFDWAYNKKTEYEYGTNANDKTTAIYIWDASIPDWVGQSKSGVTYASNGKIGSQFSYTWSNGGWIGVSMIEYEYGSGKDNTKAEYVWGDSTWVGKNKEAHEFYENGDIKGNYTFSWANNQWENKTLEEYTYNEYGDTIMLIIADWKDGSWSLLKTSIKRDVTYYDHELGLISSDAKYTWSTNKVNWVGASYYEKSYDSNYDMIEYVTYEWKNKVGWIGKSKEKRTYDTWHNVIVFESWGWLDEDWYGLQKKEWSYDSIRNLMNASYEWDMDRVDWRGKQKIEYEFNSQGTNTSTIIYGWNEDLWKWEISIQSTFVYDSKGNIVEDIQIQQNAGTKILYTYDTKGNKVLTERYSLNLGNWVLVGKDSIGYDQDEAYKQRIILNSTWTVSGVLVSYKLTSNFYACDPKFQVTIEASPAEGGSVAGGGEFILNGQATLVATPELGCYEFDHWEDEDGNTDTNNPKKVIVNEDKTYTAIFKPIQKTIKASVGAGHGSVAVKLKSTTISGGLPAGTVGAE